MKIKRILVSQPTPAVVEKSPFHDIVLKHNVELTFCPFIKLEGVTLKEFHSQRIDVLAHTAVIFTSRITIDNFFNICEKARITIPENMKYFCTTEAVALYLQKYIVYRKRKIFFADGVFSNFIDLLLKHKSETFLLTLSEPHKPEMPMALEKLKLKFSKVILAHTVCADNLDRIQISDFDLLVFYSPSEIASLTSSFKDLDGTPKIATFGHGTTRAALQEGLTIHVMAPTPEIPSMTKAIDLFIEELSAGKEIAPITLEDESPDLAYIQAQEAKTARRTRTAKSPATKSAPDKKEGGKTATTKSKTTAAKGSTTK